MTGIDRPIDGGFVALLPPHSCRPLARMYARAARAAIEEGRFLRREEVELLRVLEAVANRDASEIGSAEVVADDDQAPSPHEFVSVHRAAAMLAVGTRRVTQLLGAGRLAGQQQKPGGAWSVDLESVHEHLRKRA